MNYSKLIKNLKRELIKYPINRDSDNKNNQWQIIVKKKKNDGFCIIKN